MAAALLSVAFAATAAAQITSTSPCAPTVVLTIEERGIDRERIEKMDIVPIAITGGPDITSYHSEAWVRVKGCKGHIVVVFDEETCGIVDTYTRSNC